jgi:hypothetical protein
MEKFRIQDPGCKKFGSGMNIATLIENADEKRTLKHFDSSGFIPSIVLSE